ncbi:MAG TPA: hypothetical protein VLA23_08635 [Candidatus Limnocylindrales bacterium]|nr:hypothetical protein [Candidatus Limnocylindrales bacterium]
MPPEAYALVATFAATAVVCGLLAGAIAARAGGPRGVRWAILPMTASFVALYWVGHRLALVAGPQVELFGFQVSVVLDVGVALIAALAMAAVQVAASRVARAAR